MILKCKTCPARGWLQYQCAACQALVERGADPASTYAPRRDGLREESDAAAGIIEDDGTDSGEDDYGMAV